MNVEIDRLTKRLEATFTRASDPSISDELRSDLARHLCVLVSGYLEESLRVLLSTYAGRCSNAKVSTFVDASIRTVTNLKVGRIRDILRSFDCNWGEKFSDKLEDAQKDAIDSVVANRHLIAHGKNTGISLATVSGYWKKIQRVVQMLEQDVVV